MDSALKTADWREVVDHPEIHIVAELIGGTGVAREIIEAAIARGKSVVTANKELMALAGAELWDRAIAARINLAMEASVAGGIPIHAVLREGISGDRIKTLYGILNGTCNYILTEIERAARLSTQVLAEAQQAGYAEADPSADVDGFDARSKLAILSALAFGERIVPARHLHRRHPPHHAGRFRVRASVASHHPADLRRAPDARRPDPFRAPFADSAIDHSRRACAAHTTRFGCSGQYGADTFYYGRGAGPHPTGVAVVSDLMRVAREIRSGSPERVSPFAHARLGEY